MEGLLKTDFASLSGWQKEDHKAAFAAFRASASHLLSNPPKSRAGSANAEHLLTIAKRAILLDADMDGDKARAFFEYHFTPYNIENIGLLTGYYEPVFDGRLKRDSDYRYPLHRRPEDLVPVSTTKAIESGFTPETSFARKTETGLVLHASRGEVMAGALDGMGLELVWLRDPFDAYIIHIQGSARIRLADGETMRVAFDGKSGHAYKSLGKLLIERGAFTPETITMEGLIDHLRGMGEDGEALLAQNPSYIYFKAAETLSGQSANDGPVAAAQVPLQPLRSIAVDRHLHTFGMPFWIETDLPQGENKSRVFQHLVFAHDTGSAIKGAARADLFVGTGREAGHLAGRLQQQARFTCLMPNPLTDGSEDGQAPSSISLNKEADRG